jgi:excisionase family DNA binding protein
MLTAAEVRAQLKISQRTLFRLIHSGQIEAIKTGPGRNAEIRVSEEALAAFLEARKVQPRQEVAAS